MTNVRTEIFNRSCLASRHWEQLSKIHPDYLEFLPVNEKQNFQSQIKSLQRKQKKSKTFIPPLNLRTIIFLGIMSSIPLSAAFARTFVFRTNLNTPLNISLNPAMTKEQDFEQKLTQLSEVLSVIVSAVKRHEVALVGYDSRSQKQSISPISFSLPSFFSFEEETFLEDASIPITVNVSNARLRTAPTISSDILATLDKGTDLLAAKVKDGWILVTAPTGQDAWIRKDLISVKNVS